MTYISHTWTFSFGTCTCTCTCISRRLNYSVIIQHLYNQTHIFCRIRILHCRLCTMNMYILYMYMHVTPYYMYMFTSFVENKCTLAEYLASYSCLYMCIYMYQNRISKSSLCPYTMRILNLNDCHLWLQCSPLPLN